ncbi:MAG TPA: hypothetical protein VFS12_17815, partial [Terriglobia bacterium]|nr:hypothetical protein [Terriglobia bacterium]
VHFAHASGSDGAENFVGTESSAGSQRHKQIGFILSWNDFGKASRMGLGSGGWFPPLSRDWLPAKNLTLENTSEIGCLLGEPAPFRLGYNTP